MAGGGQASAGAIPPIVTRVGKEVDALDGGKDLEGGLGVGGEPLLVGGAGSPKPFCLQPSLWGGGARSWGKSHRALPTMPSGRARGGPLLIIFTLGLPIHTYCYVKMTTRTSTALRDDLGWDKSPENPQLEQRRGCRLPPAGGGGWDCFLLMQSVRQGHNLSVSRRPVRQLEVREDRDKSD